MVYIAKIRQKFGATLQDPVAIPESLDGPNLALQNALRLQYTRWFKFVELDGLIAEYFGASFMFEDPKNYKIIRRCALQIKDGWKHEAIQRFENQISNLIKIHPKRNIKSISDTATLRDIFRDLFSFNDVETIFWWAQDIIDLSMSSNACRTFIFGKYISFPCIQLLKLLIVELQDS